LIVAFNLWKRLLLRLLILCELDAGLLQMRHHLGPLAQLQIRRLHPVDVHGLAVRVGMRERSLLRVLQLENGGVLVGPGGDNSGRERRVVQRRILLLVEVLRVGADLEVRVELPGLE